MGPLKRLACTKYQDKPLYPEVKGTWLAAASFVAEVETIDIWANSSCNLLVPSGPITYIPLPFVSKWLLCTSNFMTWWGR